MTALVPERQPVSPAYVVATMGGIGLVPIGPGSWGSLLVLPAVLLGPVLCLVLGVALSLVGWWATRQALRERPEDPDPKWIVVDEGAGQLIALAGLPADADATGLVLAFALFRAFDVLKVGPVGWADRHGGPVGVMLDDIIAGILALAGLIAFHYFYPGVLN